MRIVSGFLKGRRIQAPANLPTRPTTDFAKESLFNILNNRVDFDDLDVLDLFAGIGSISYEFASRGAKSVLAVENNPKCADFIKQTAEHLHIENLYVMRTDAFAYIAKTRQTFDVIFADPPYDLQTINLLPSLIFEYNLLNPNGYFILEHSEQYDFSAISQFFELRKYGKVHFSFFNEK
ncbi:MAG: 16S rRNA (guanine(966)-N(2))-methyltransferase RsmD [Bacteroidales bacterium]|nr:16S rRNA (guanine(966)-N(2))-methyltransferase RsmD [Bacteroidales bacterium]